ncbi:recombination regulator RecX [Francisellaceae bacterium]|nr:recombination regulator RecX [Francisellaceae bacterium]
MLTKHKNYVLYLLSRREYSRQEISQKLTQRHLSQSEIEKIFDYLDEYQSDKRCAEQLVRVQTSKLNGKNKILQTAYAKGIDDVLIEYAIEILDIDWFNIAKQAYQKKYGSIEDQPLDWSDKQKRMRFLVSRGFSFDEAKEAVETQTNK